MTDEDIKLIVSILMREALTGGDMENEQNGRLIRELKNMRDNSQKWLHHRAAEWQKKRKKRRK